jgi:two-component system nitrate/nitrite response regulator NarL
MLFVLTVVEGIAMDEGVGVDDAVTGIILADAQIIYRIGILQLLESEIDMRVVAQADTLAALHGAVERFCSQSPTRGASECSVILVEGSMISTTANAIAGLIRRAPRAKIIVQLEAKNESKAVELYRCGASGVVPRSVSPNLLVKCVRKVAAGEIWIDNESVNRLIEAYQFQTITQGSSPPQAPLSPKERAIIIYIAQGKSNKEIAQRLGTNEQVVKNYLRKVFDKVGVTNRVDLAAYGLHYQFHKITSDSGVLRNASAGRSDVQGKPNGVDNF